MVGRDNNMLKFDHIEFEVGIKSPDVEIQQPEVNTNQKDVVLAGARDWRLEPQGKRVFTKVIYKDAENVVGSVTIRKTHIYRVTAEERIENCIIRLGQMLFKDIGSLTQQMLKSSV